jgi:hypothetical protein
VSEHNGLHDASHYVHWLSKNLEAWRTFIEKFGSRSSLGRIRWDSNAELLARFSDVRGLLPG